MATSGYGAGYAQPKTGVPAAPAPPDVRAATTTKTRKTEAKSEEKSEES